MCGEHMPVLFLPLSPKQYGVIDIYIVCTVLGIISDLCIIKHTWGDVCELATNAASSQRRILASSHWYLQDS